MRKVFYPFKGTGFSFRTLLAIGLLTIFNSYAQALTISLEVDGLDSDAKESLLNSITLYQQRESPNLNDEYINRLLQTGVKELNSAMQAFGYYSAKSRFTEKQVDDEREITYFVDKGTATLVTNLTIQIEGPGKAQPEIQEWLKQLPLKKGVPFNHADYEEAKKSLFEIFHEHGYFSGRLSHHEVLIDPVTHQASVDLDVVTGPRSTFGAVTYIQTNEVFNTRYLNKYLNFANNDPFDSAKLNELHERLLAGQQFSKIDVEAKINQRSDEQVPITVTVEPKKRNKYTLGLGYGTDTGPRVKAGLERRRITTSAHQIAFETLVSKNQSSLKGSYRIPLSRPYSDYFLATGQRIIEDIDSQYRQTNSVNFSSNFRRVNWLRSYFVSLESERYRILGEDDNHTRYVIPGVSVTYQPSEKNYAQRFISEFKVVLKLTHKDLFSEANVSQISTFNQVQYRLTPRLSLVSRLNTGFTDVEKIEKLPASLRFFAGGDNSIRGFSYNSLGPKNDAGEVEGGKNLMVFSLEARRKQGADKEISIFFDTGNAYNQALLDLESGAGFGFGWQFPFGVVRIYAASALSTAGNPWRLHLTLGAQL